MEDAERSSRSLLDERDWDRVAKFWSDMMLRPSLPSFVSGNPLSGYGLTDLKSIHAIGIEEYASKDPRFKRQTFAIRIGYDGSKYNGYQMQKGVVNVRTVESDVMAALGGRTCVAAGRTDKDVSALSQIISFSTYEELTVEELLSSMKSSPPCACGSLAVWEVVRAPKRFHALFSATWRRYIYLFPTQQGPFEHGVDVDVRFVASCLKRIEGQALHYNAFAFGEVRGTEDTASDVCTLFKTRAFLVNLDTGEPVTPEGTADLRNSTLSSTRQSPLAVCVELVGSRFLRRMVRLLVGTAIRESMLTHDPDTDPDPDTSAHTGAEGREQFVRDEEALLRICRSGDRSAAARALPGIGLALCGVGYSTDDLCMKKHNIMAKNKDKGDKGCGIKGNVSDRGLDQSASEGNTPCVSVAPRRKLFKADEAWVETLIESLSSRNPHMLYFPQREFTFALAAGTTVSASHGCADSSRSIPAVREGDIAHSMAGSQASVASDESIVIMVEQSVAGVGSTVWDAEVILAHYLHTLPALQLASENILELGAGTAIAAILCMKKGASVTVQELAEVMPHTLQCLKMNRTEARKALACRWGEECVRLATDGFAVESVPSAAASSAGSKDEARQSTSSEFVQVSHTMPEQGEHVLSTLVAKQTSKKRKKSCLKTDTSKIMDGMFVDSMRFDGAARGETRYDRVLMADVLYHVEDFTALISTVICCIKPRGVLVLSFEQRRKNLDSFVQTLISLFHAHEAHTVSIEQAEEIEGGDGCLKKETVTVFHLHIFRSKISEI